MIPDETLTEWQRDAECGVTPELDNEFDDRLLTLIAEVRELRTEVSLLKTEREGRKDIAMTERVRAESAERSKAALVEKVKRLEDLIARTRLEGTDRAKAVVAYADRAGEAEAKVAELRAERDEVEEFKEQYHEQWMLAEAEVKRLRNSLAGLVLEATGRCNTYPEHPHWEAWNAMATDLNELLEGGTA